MTDMTTRTALHMADIQKRVDKVKLGYVVELFPSGSASWEQLTSLFEAHELADIKASLHNFGSARVVQTVYRPIPAASMIYSAYQVWYYRTDTVPFHEHLIQLEKLEPESSLRPNQIKIHWDPYLAGFWGGDPT